MKTSIVVLIGAVCLLLGIYLGSTIQTQPSFHHQEDMHEHHDHGQSIAWVGEDPQLSLEVTQDAKSGWNVRILTTNFDWAPENANQEHIDGQGHAHLYVNGKKVARVYNEWFHMDPLGPGQHHVHVSLNANTHETYAIDGQLLEAMVNIAE